MRKEIVVVGLGKMGAGIVRQLLEKGWTDHGFNRSQEIVEELAGEGMRPLNQLKDIFEIAAPRLVWLMLPAGKTVDDLLFEDAGIVQSLARGDTVIDGGNSFFKDSQSRGARLAESGIRFIDVGFSGGPSGARSGGCLMVGGDEASYREYETLFKDLAKDGTAYAFFPGAGAGHFVKMVHNGIEYGMMQAIGEGFAILKASDYGIDLPRAAAIYQNGSVIESRLVGWLGSGFKEYGADLAEISSTIGHTGEGEWTAQTAHELGIPAPIIEGSFQFRVQSAEHPSFIGKVVSALRGQFGGHKIK
jgi:6-phosphogluconate dehydrogenase